MFSVRTISVLSAGILCAAATFATCFAQSPATFHTQTYAERASYFPYAIDLNNDGILDLVQETVQPAGTSNTFTVRIANGNGSFRAPMSYTFPTRFPGGSVMAFGDFNGDGKMDLIFFPGTTGNQLVLLLGKGDGTFQAPRYITVALQSDQYFAGGVGFLAADFTGDGKLDLVISGSAGTGSVLFLIPGDGTGNFGTPSIIFTMSSPYESFGGYAEGDFDGDGRADVAVVDDYCVQNGCTGLFHVIYNDGNSAFTDTVPYSSPGQFSISVGDLNSDGTTDIFETPWSASGHTLVVLYGQTDRTFHTYTIPVPSISTLGMADLNGDTRMDLVGTAPNSSGTGYQLVSLLADSGEGVFTQQTYGLPSYPGASAPLVGVFNSDTKPDVLTLMQKSLSAGNTTSIIVDALNTTAQGFWGGCSYPHSGQGITVCAPNPSSASPVTFDASANSFGQLRLMELWVDGKKIGDQYHAWGQRAWFDLTGTTLTPGSHRGVLFAKDIDNRQQETAFNFTVGGAACLIPSTAGVNICAPASGSTVSSPVQVRATSKVNGTLARMQLWVDGVNKFTSTSNTLTTSISLAAGTHRFAVVATNTAGQKWESAVNATVK
jgi:hypothetical protein